MAIDISAELDAIASDLEGEEVALAIAQGLELLANELYKGSDISTNLEIIRNGTYGKDIRQAVYNSIKALSEVEPDSGRGDYITGNVGAITGVKGTFCNTGLYRQPGYAFLEYIKSTGTQYIMTDIVPEFTDICELDVAFSSTVDTDTNANNGIFGYYGDTTGSYGVRLQNGVNPRGSGYDGLLFYMGFQWNSGLSGGNEIRYITPSNRSTLIAQRGNCYWGNSSCNGNYEITSNDLTTGIPIFAFNNFGNINPLKRRDMTLYSFKIYDGNTLIHHLSPVEKSNGAVGLLDILTGKFYGNSGTDDFIKGNYI